MKQQIAIILCFVMLVSVVMTGCTKSKGPDLTGEWKATISISDYMNENMSSSSLDLGDRFDFKDLSFQVIMTFGEDGTCSVKVDEASWTKLVSDLSAQLKDPLIKYFEELLEESQMGLTVEQLLASMNVTMDELINQMTSELSADEILANLNTSGYYQIQENMLFISESKDEAFDKAAANAFVLDGSKLTLEVSEKDKENEYASIMFPLALEKTN